MSETSISTRMKENYENRYRFKLTRRTPIIMRLDGKAFHTLTKKCDKPFDQVFAISMDSTTKSLMRHIQGAKCAYTQSDEISILLTDFDTLDTEAWFDYNIQKMTSVGAGYASMYFSKYYEKDAVFDCRVFNIPKEEVNNYFLCRQLDWFRNCTQMVAQSHFSHKELRGKGQTAMWSMLEEKNVYWAEIPMRFRWGFFIMKTPSGFVPIYQPDFKKYRHLIEQFLEEKE